MQVRRFFCADLTEDTAVLSEEESFHALKVLRLAPGDALMLLDGRGTVAQAELLEITGSRKQSRAVCRILDRRQPPQKGPRIHLHVAPPKGKNFDLLLKSATELGVHRIVPVLCRYGVVHPREKLDGFQQTLVTACKQCCNPWLPEMTAPMEFGEAVRQAGPDGCFGASPTHQDIRPEILKSWGGKKDFAVWIGPEGGFAPDEEQQLLQAGMQPVTIGPWTLRVETAVPAMLGFLYANL